MRGFGRIALCIPDVWVADPARNVEAMLEVAQSAADGHAQVAVFPELSLSAYTARDLFLQHTLLDGCQAALAQFLRACPAGPLFLVGLPWATPDGIYNVAAAVQDGRLLGVVPKAHLPQGAEYEERRWFRPGVAVRGRTLPFSEGEVPFGRDLVFDAGDGLCVGVEICEDMWVPRPPSMDLCTAGATVICNLSASNVIVGKADIRRRLAQGLSDRGKCAYAYVAAGPGESSTDMAFDGDGFVSEMGRLLVESERFARGGHVELCDVDLGRLAHERWLTPSFFDDAEAQRFGVRRIPFSAPAAPGLLREVSRTPFVPRRSADLEQRAYEIFEIQSQGLATRMRALGRPKLVLGVSGGLDSTHAALVAANALDANRQPRTDLVCLTMPGLGTSAGTRSNATALARQIGATLREVSVSELSRLVLRDLGHPAATGRADVDQLVQALRDNPALADTTVENVQARMRTLLLMNVANHEGGIVVGTGDLSEKALGWATYAGDHISMYDVNASVPKTLIQFLIQYVAETRVDQWTAADPGELKATLQAIVDTPISPELLPPDEEGRIAQHTEAAIGPYVLHDFFLFHLVREGASVQKVLDLARHAFSPDHDDAALREHFDVFLRRFFSQQFKRSCTADAPKVGSVSLSPRTDWRMASDAQVSAWRAALRDAR